MPDSSTPPPGDETPQQSTTQQSRTQQSTTQKSTPQESTSAREALAKEVQPESPQPESNQSDSNQSDSNQSDSNRAESTGESTPKRGLQVVVAVLVGVLAFAIVTQTKDTENEDFSNVRSEDLVELLRSLDASNQRLDDQIDELTTTRDDLRDSNKRTEAATAEARQRADALAILAGTVPAKGPGIAITVADPDQRVSAAAILDAIEEMRNAGAEVIAVNGSARIVGNSYVVNSDSGIRIDGRSLQAPYLIEAIGDPETLAEAAGILGGLTETLERLGASVDIDEKDLISITALADAKDPEYARPDS